MEISLLSIDNVEECRIVQRVNRFVVDVQVQTKLYRAWINNTGRLRGYLVPGKTGFCVPRHGQGKTDYRLFAIQDGHLGALIDTQWQMSSLESGLRGGLFPWLNSCREFRRCPRLSESIIDYLLQCDSGAAYLEVKSAVLRQGAHALYPDCPSLRGRKQVRELTRHVAQGGKAYLVFVAALPGVEAFRPNHAGDPQLTALVHAAHEAGVEIRSVGMLYRPDSGSVVLYDPDLRVDLA
jgi:sugar fermentation stimulation protein A